MDITHYHVPASLDKDYRLALVTDLHNGLWKPLRETIRREAPDAVMIAGDLLGNLTTRGARSLAFLRALSREFPVFYAFGNHERWLGPKHIAVLRETGAVVLINETAQLGELTVGGLLQDIPGKEEQLTEEHLAFVRRFAGMPGYRILLCHRPEWYFDGIRDYDIPLVLSGHAHGGQIRLFGHPVYSPGQGLFPKYAQGMHEGRLIVSRGLGNHTVVPRFFNAPELCIVTIGAESPLENTERTSETGSCQQR